MERFTIDQLIFSGRIVLNECKNTNEDFKPYWDWFETHVSDRYVKGLPIVQDLARILGISTTTFSLTTPTYKPADGRVAEATKSLRLEVIVTSKQALAREDFSC